MSDERRTTIQLNIPATAEEREAYRLMAWDRWYATLPDDMKRRLSLHDFKRLGECFQQAFGVREILSPPSREKVAGAILARARGETP